MSIDFEKLFSDLDNVYKACPDLPCIKCGICCSSPHLSFVEFCYFLDYALRAVSQEKLIEIVSKEPEPSKRLNGHIECPLLEDKLCVIHGGRGISCRYIGVPELSAGYGLNEPLCPHITHENMGVKVTVDEIENALDVLAGYNAEIYEYLSEPYYLDALNLQCWFAVCLDKNITQPLFVKLRGIIREKFDLDFLEPYYKNTTRIKEKLDLVDRFFEFNEQQKPQEARFCMEQVRDNFPNTGAYYNTQSHIYIEFMNSLINVVETDPDNRPGSDKGR